MRSEVRDGDVLTTASSTLPAGDVREGFLGQELEQGGRRDFETGETGAGAQGLGQSGGGGLVVEVRLFHASRPPRRSADVDVSLSLSRGVRR